MLEAFLLLAMFSLGIAAVASVAVASVILYAALVIWREIRESGK